MENKQKGRFFIRFSNEGIALSPEHVLTFSSTNLPYTSMQIHPHAEWYWYVSIRNYDKSTGRLQVHVDEYKPSDVRDFFTQTPKSIVNRLEFAELRWPALEQHLSSYRKAAFERLLLPEHDTGINAPKIVQRTSDWNHSMANREIQHAFSVPFQKAKFVTGGVLVTHKIDEYEVQLMIDNSFILKEFDLLKEYFSRALGKKQFHVNARIRIEEGKINEAIATSPEISRIDERMLDSVKYLEAKAIKHIAPPDANKELFTADEMYGYDAEEGPKGTGIELMEILLRDANIRNRKQIQYLAGKLHKQERKILFTAHPHFGFVFKIQGESLGHFVWELLNSHATYLWSYDTSTVSENLALRRLEYALSTIRKQGRQTYRLEMPGDSGSSDLIFHVIRHDHISSGIVDSFPVWRARLHERLV